MLPIADLSEGHIESFQITDLTLKRLALFSSCRAVSAGKRTMK